MTRPGASQRPGGGRATTALRPLGLPRLLQVRADGQRRPVAIAHTDVRGHPDRWHHVERIDEVWRLAEAWWREETQRRTYYRVLLEGGRPLMLFHDDMAQAWFEQPYTAPAGTGAGR